MSSVGEILRLARENQGRTLAGVAEELCITERYLRAIESDDVAALPGAFFYRSFVKQYAALLGVDQARVQSSLDTETAAAVKPGVSEVIGATDPIVESTNQLHLSGHGWRSAAALVAVLLVCSGFYAWWTRVPVPANAAVSPSQVKASPANTVRTASSTPVVQTPALPPQVSATITPTSDPNTVVLNLSATQTTWLSIRSGGKEIFQGILRPGEPMKTVAGQQLATMKIGNAGGVDISLNGKPIGPLGPQGQVMLVRFTPERFEILPPAADEEHEESNTTPPRRRPATEDTPATPPVI